MRTLPQICAASFFIRSSIAIERLQAIIKIHVMTEWTVMMAIANVFTRPTTSIVFFFFSCADSDKHWQSLVKTCDYGTMCAQN